MTLCCLIENVYNEIVKMKAKDEHIEVKVEDRFVECKIHIIEKVYKERFNKYLYYLG
jgi:hypothetical protein